MGLFLLVLFTLGSISATVIYITSSDQIASRSSNSKVSGRMQAQVISEYLYAKTLSDGNFLNQLLNTQSCQDYINSGAFPGLNCNGQFINYAKVEKGVDGNFNRVNGEGTIVNCNGDLKSDCVSYYVKPFTIDPSTNRIIAVKIFAKARSGCNSQGARCRTTTYSQLLRSIQFFDYLYYVKYTTLDPSLYNGSLTVPGLNPNSDCRDKFAQPSINGTDTNYRDNRCITIPLTERDTFNSPIYTYDNYFVLCGSPNISPINILSRGSNQRNNSSVLSASDPTIGDICSSEPTYALYSNFSGINLDLSLKGSAYSGAGKLIAGAGLRVVDLGGGSSSLTISGNQVSCSGSCSGNSTVSLDRPTVIKSGGSIDITGQAQPLNGKLSIVSSGNITISGDITYSDRSASGTSVLSLIADQNIIIKQITPTACGETLTRNIDAYMLSVNNAIQVENWQNDVYTPIYNNLNCVGANFNAQLNIYGSIVGKYQPIFGAYDGNGTGLVSGYGKAFTFDDRVKNGKVSIPYIIPPQTQQWVKLAMTEIASN